MALPATEAFTGGAGPVGANWTQQRTTRTVNRDGAGLGTQDAGDNAADVTAFWSADPFASDHYSQVTLVALGTGGTGNSNNVVVRASASGDASWNAYDWYTDGLSGAGNTELAKVISGGSTVLRNYVTTFAANDVIKVSVQGTTIEAFKNGVSLGTQVDSAIPSGGAPGIGSFSSTTSTNKPTFDNWQGDNIGSAGAWVYGTRRAPAKAGPYDPKGFLLSNFKRFNYTPSTVVAGSVTLTPDVGSLLLDGFAPTFPVTVAPGFGALTLTGLAPTFPTVLVPGFGQLVLTGFSPTLGLPQTIVTGLGSLVLTGAAPTFPTTLLPGTGSLILTGLAPSIGTPVTVVPGLGALVLTGQPPTFPRTILPGVGQLILSGFAPTLGLPQTLRPGLGLLVLDGFSPSFASGTTLQPGLGALTLTGFAPTLGLPRTIVPGLGALTLTGLAPQIGVPVTVRPGLGALTLTGFGPAFTFVPGTILYAIAHSDGTVSLSPSFLGTFGLVAVNVGIAPIGSGDSRTSSLNSANSGVSPIDPDN